MFSLLLIICLVQADQPMPPTQMNYQKVTDFLPPNYTTVGSEPSTFVAYKNRMFFYARRDFGWSLFQSDGLTVQPVMLPGKQLIRQGGADPELPTISGGRLYFKGSSDFNSGETSLWALDRIGATPRKVTDTQEYAGFRYRNYAAGVLIAEMNTPYVKLFLDDGHSTKLLGEVHIPHHFSFQLTGHGNQVYFIAGENGEAVQVWRTVGSDRIEPVIEIQRHDQENPTTLLNGSHLQSFGDNLQLFSGIETQAGATWQLATIKPDTGEKEVAYQETFGTEEEVMAFSRSFVHGSYLFFKRGDSWRYFDGDIHFMNDLFPGLELFNPSQITPFEKDGNTGFFTSQREDKPSGIYSTALYKFVPATGEHERLVLRESIGFHSYQIKPNGDLLFVVGPPGKFRPSFLNLWVSDGTTGGTKPLSLKELIPLSDYAYLNDNIYIQNYHPIYGLEPHLINGDESVLLADINRTPEIRNPEQLTTTFHGQIRILAHDRILDVRHGQVESETPLAQMQGEGLVESNGRLFLIADQKKRLFEMTPTGPQLLVDKQLISEITDVQSYGANTLAIGNALPWEEIDPPTPHDNWEHRLLWIDPAGNVSVIHAGEYSHQTVVNLNGTPAFAHYEADQFSFRTITDGTPQIVAEFNDPDLQADRFSIMGVVGETVYYRTNNANFAPGDFCRDNPNCHTKIFAATKSGVEVAFDGLIDEFIQINDRIIIWINHEIFVITPGEGLTKLLDQPNPRFVDQPKGLDHAVISTDNGVYLSDGTPDNTFRLTHTDDPFRYLGSVSGTHFLEINRENVGLYTVTRGDSPQLLMNAPTNGTATNPVIFGDSIYTLFTDFNQRHELWRLNHNGASLVKQLNPELLSDYYVRLTAMVDGVYFTTPADGPDGLTLHSITPGEPTPPPTVTINAPQTLSPYRIGIARLPNLPSGSDVSWQIDGGTFVQAPQRDALVFKAGFGPKLTLNVTVTTPAGPLTGSHTIDINFGDVLILK